MSHLLNKYISDLPQFSQDICSQLDKLIHKIDSSLIEERKWGSLTYSKKNGLIFGFYPTKDGVTLRFFWVH